MEIVRLTKSGLKQDIENGIKRTDMAAKYNLPITQLNKAISQAGLKGTRAKTIRFELIEDEPEIMESYDAPAPAPEEFNTPSAPSME